LPTSDIFAVFLGWGYELISFGLYKVHFPTSSASPVETAKKLVVKNAFAQWSPYACLKREEKASLLPPLLISHGRMQAAIQFTL